MAGRCDGKRKPEPQHQGPCTASNNARLFMKEEKYAGESYLRQINGLIRKYGGSIKRQWRDWWGSRK